jgi:hypothetical protein
VFRCFRTGTVLLCKPSSPTRDRTFLEKLDDCQLAALSRRPRDVCVTALKQRTLGTNEMKPTGTLSGARRVTGPIDTEFLKSSRPANGAIPNHENKSS